MRSTNRVQSDTYWNCPLLTTLFPSLVTSALLLLLAGVFFIAPSTTLDFLIAAVPDAPLNTLSTRILPPRRGPTPCHDRYNIYIRGGGVAWEIVRVVVTCEEVDEAGGDACTRAH